MENAILTVVSVIIFISVIVCVVVFTYMKNKNLRCPNCRAKYQAEGIVDVKILSTNPLFITLLVTIYCLNCSTERQVKIRVRNSVGESMDMKFLAAKYFEGHHAD